MAQFQEIKYPLLVPIGDQAHMWRTHGAHTHTYIHSGKHPLIQNKNKQILGREKGKRQSREEPSRRDTNGQQQKDPSLSNVGFIVPRNLSQPNLNYQGAISHPPSPLHTLFSSSRGMPHQDVEQKSLHPPGGTL